MNIAPLPPFLKLVEDVIVKFLRYERVNGILARVMKCFCPLSDPEFRMLAECLMLKCSIPEIDLAVMEGKLTILVPWNVGSQGAIRK